MKVYYQDRFKGKYNLFDRIRVRDTGEPGIVVGGIYTEQFVPRPVGVHRFFVKLPGEMRFAWFDVDELDSIEIA